MPNGSLDDALFQGTIPLPWPQKFKILAGASEGLSYLHQGLTQQVIHRDIKCSNILLDKELNAKLGDFGISRMVVHQGRAATTDMAGTMGYMAPEVFLENRFTYKADVYAFGVVILEVVCGRRVLPRASSHDMNLVQWVRFCHDKGNLLSTVDKRYRDGDTKQIRRVLEVGLLCTQLNPQDRPSMRRVLQMLAGDVMVPSVPNLKPTSGLLPARLKNLFYRKVSGLPPRSPPTLSSESPVDLSGSDPAAYAGVQNDRRSAMNNSSVPAENEKWEGRGSDPAAYTGVQNDRRSAMNNNSVPAENEKGEGRGSDPAAHAGVQNDRRSAMNNSAVPAENEKEEGRGSDPAAYAGVQNDRRRAMNNSSVPAENEKGEGRTATGLVEIHVDGVLFTFAALPGGGKDLTRVRFSPKVFGVKQAEQWWADNRERVRKQYDVRLLGSKEWGTTDASRPREDDRDRVSL